MLKYWPVDLSLGSRQEFEYEDGKLELDCGIAVSAGVPFVGFGLVVEKGSGFCSV